jgi:hypothetical protein
MILKVLIVLCCSGLTLKMVFNCVLYIPSSMSFQNQAISKMEDIHYASSVTTIFVFFLLYLWLPGPSGGTSLVVNEYKDGVSYPRGPEPWPLLGNLVHFSKISKRPDRELLKLAKQYGGLTMMWLGFHPILIINKARDAKNLLDNV